MALREELGLFKPIESPGHEALMNVLVTASMLEKEGDRVLRPFRLTASQFNLLILLKYQSFGGSINQTQLGDMMLVNRSNVTGLVDRTERRGWVRRVADPEDRRVNLIQLTKEGRRVIESAETAYFKRIEEVVAGIGKRENQTLCAILEGIRNAIRSKLEEEDR